MDRQSILNLLFQLGFDLAEQRTLFAKLLDQYLAFVIEPSG